MSQPDREPIGLTLLKLVAALCLILLALAFGAGGACGVTVALAGFSQAGSGGGLAVIGAVCAVVGLGVAGMLVWGAVLIFRKQERRR
jgi:hypothetical protein